MKKSALLLTVILIPLTGCSKIKTPTFERHSNAVTYEYFLASFEGGKYSDYFKFEESCKGKVYYGSEFSNSSKLGDVSITELTGTSESEINFSYDSENRRSTLKEKGESSLVSTGAEVDEQKVSKTSTSVQYQFENSLNSFIYLDTKEKTYKKYANSNITDNIYNLIDDEYFYFSSALKQYETVIAEGKTSFEFYIDGSVFTMIESYSDSREMIAPGGTEPDLKRTIDNQYLYQFEIKDEKFLFRSKTVTQVVSTYLTSYSNHLKNEVDVDKQTTYCSLEISIGKVNIKAIDISSYVTLDKDPVEAH